ncbi:MAG: hypothetical protein M5T61_00875 [Acidimicrobiia bacterium]|nr:hypothetical protein [Acidimicrobiia bacterium]
MSSLRGHWMAQGAPVAALSRLSRPTLGVFRGSAAVQLGVTRKQLRALCVADVIARELPDTYRMTAVTPSDAQRLHAALLWAGGEAAADGRSAGACYGLEGVRAGMPEIVVPRRCRRRSAEVAVRRVSELRPLMLRRHRGVRVTGIEATLVHLAHLLDGEAFEVACEDARRRRLTSVPALHAYLDRFAQPGHRGVAQARSLLGELDPAHASRSTLEVKTRRLLSSNGFGDYSRELPLAWNGRTYLFDFAFEQARTILEVNGRRWHDDPSDYEHDNEKWSVPGRCGYKIVFATWDKVTRRPGELLAELAATLAA